MDINYEKVDNEIFEVKPEQVVPEVRKVILLLELHNKHLLMTNKKIALQAEIDALNVKIAECVEICGCEE